MNHTSTDICMGPTCRRPNVDSAPAIVASGLGLSYPGQRGLALSDFDASIPTGECVALIGANGSGKSTLLKAIAGILRPCAGSLQVYGHKAGRCRHHVAYLPQRSEIDWRFPISLRRLVLAGRYVHLGWFRRPKASDQAFVDQALQRLQLSDLADRPIGALSGGQQQRALLARALVQRSDLMLLDEPLNAVDRETRQLFADVLSDLKRGGRTLIVATHDLGPGREYFDTIIGLHEGRRLDLPENRLLDAIGEQHHCGH